MTTTGDRAERLAGILETEAVPTDGDDEVVFDAPWQARVFGLAVALYEADDGRDWAAFQRDLAGRIGAADPARMQGDVEAAYYREWLECLEDDLVDSGVLEPDEIDRRAHEFTAGERDASEFVVGDPTH